MDPIQTISLKILNKDYQISCPPGSEELLFAAAHYLDQKLREIRSAGRVIGLERMAIMAGLNIANELLIFRQQKEEYVHSVTQQIERLQNKIDEALMDDSSSKEELLEI